MHLDRDYIKIILIILMIIVFKENIKTKIVLYSLLNHKLCKVIKFIRYTISHSYFHQGMENLGNLFKAQTHLITRLH